MAANLPLGRKLERAFAGYLIDCQAADPTFLPGFAIVCATSARSPDDPREGEVEPAEPDLPYLSVGCKHVRCRPGFDVKDGVKDAAVLLCSKTHASDEASALADERLACVVERLENTEAVVAALNQPADPGTADARRQQALYLYGIEDIEVIEEDTQTTWEPETILHVCCQGCDPAYAP